jgi:tRNA pseudouridine13 synthase
MPLQLPLIEIKKEPSDFIVEEIMPNGIVLEIDKPLTFSEESFSEDKPNNFLHFVMQKRDWNTASAIRRIARALHTTHKRFDCAGTKDKFALTTQRVSMFKGDKEKLLGLKLKDIKILGAWYASDKIRLGELVGNRFRIKVYNAGAGPKPQLLNKMFNFFGPQRFGTTRNNTHIIGKHMLFNEFKTAVLTYLLDSKGENSEISKSARTKLKHEMDYKKALEYFPKYLRYERVLLAHLAHHENDYINALRKLQRTTLLMFVHAYQSYLFNIELCSMIEANNIEKQINIIGTSTKITELEHKILESEHVSSEMFALKSIPELNSKGSTRPSIVNVVDPHWENDNLVFSLPCGAYASTYLLYHFNVGSLKFSPGISHQCAHKSREILFS